jgi:hypothetical protein
VTPAIDLSDAFLSVAWRSVGTHQVFAAFDDRSAWYWALATIGPGSDVVGSFRTEVPANRWAAVVDAAAMVGRVGRVRAHGELGLELTAGAATGWVAMGTDDAGRIGAAVVPVVELARANPIAAAQLGARIVTAPTGQRVAGFSLTSIGDRAVSLILDADEFALVSADGDWLPLPAPHMGLVDGAGHLLDGLYQAADIPPGVLGACTFVLDDPPTQPVARAALRGAVTLVGPWPVTPTVPFEASSAAESR